MRMLAVLALLGPAPPQEGAPGRFKIPGFGKGEHVVADAAALRAIYPPPFPQKALDDALKEGRVDFGRARLAAVGRVGSDGGWKVGIRPVVVEEKESVVRYRFWRPPVQVASAVADAVPVERSAGPVRFEQLPEPRE